MSVISAGAKGESRADATFQAGQLVDGKYRVERLIGVGGMAAVWAGTNERTGKRVALKVILRSLASTPAARELFYSEGVVASRVNHPNVVTIFDVIEHEGMTCLVMELLDGEPLSRMLERKGSLSVEEAAWLLMPAMRGVAAANAQGVIHRDLKPQNIFLCVEPDGRIVTTKVLDFGISVLVDRVLDLSRGLFVGTPNYMSPEHVAGVAIIDGRADVYGFGVLLYEALSGRMAFPGEPGEDLFKSIINKNPTSLTSLRPDLSAGMVSIIEKAMAKQPDDRFASLNAMITGLEVELLALGLGAPAPNALPGSSDPVVRAFPDNSVVASASHRETMVFYGLPDERMSEPTLGSVTPSGRDVPDTMVVRLKARPLARMTAMGWLGWKAALATAMGIALGILAWNATRPVAPAELIKPEANEGGVQTVPTVVPLATPEPVAEARTSALPEPTSVEPAGSESPAPVVTHKKVGRARSMIVSIREHAASQESPSAKSRASEEGAASETTSRTNAASKLPMRAGSLSAADF